MPAPRIVATLCAAEWLSMLGFGAAPVLLPVLIRDWGLSGTQAGAITGAFFGGYMLAVPVLTALTDRVDARRVYRGALGVTALAFGAMALAAHGFWSAFFLQALAGIGLAGTYMPGLKLLTDHVGGPRQSRYVAFYTSSFGLGASLSYLAAGLVVEWAPWRWAFWLGAIGPALALGLAFLIPPGAKPDPAVRSGARLLDFRPVFRSRKAMTFVAGYTTHNFELFGLRSWLVAFLAFAASVQPPGATVWSPAAVAALVTLVGVPASIFGNELALRMGRRREIMLAMALAALFAGTIGFAAGLPYPLLVALMLLYSLCIAGDSAALTAGAIAAAPEGYRGTTMAVHSSLGFGFGFLGSVTVGAALDIFGKTTATGWGLSFATMAVVGLAGLAAVWWLGRERPAGTGR